MGFFFSPLWVFFFLGLLFQTPASSAAEDLTDWAVSGSTFGGLLLFRGGFFLFFFFCAVERQSKCCLR